MTNQRIPEAAVEAAARGMAIHDDDDGCFREVDAWKAQEEWEREAYPENYPGSAIEDCAYWIAKARAALEAAAPHMLSHEREEARLAHLDAMVNARTADRLEAELAEAEARAWDEGKDTAVNSPNGVAFGIIKNPYRSSVADLRRAKMSQTPDDFVTPRG